MSPERPAPAAFPASPELARWLEEELPRASGEPLGRGYQAEVRLYQGPFGRVVVKEARRWPLLGFVTMWSLRREHAVYERLDGVPGVPRCLGVIRGRCLVLEHIDGVSLRRRELEGPLDDAFFARLLETLEAMHRAGIAHGDLKRKDNVLVGPGGQPYVIDFGIAAFADRSRLERLLFAAWRQMDLNAWLKLKYRRRLDLASPEDAARYRPLLIERVARAIRVPWQALTLRKLRNRNRVR